MTWGMAQDACAQGARLANKGGRANQISQAQARKQRFGKTAYINNTTICIERFQGRRGGGGVGDFKFIIILDDQGIQICRAIQQSFATIKRHGVIGGALVTGGCEDH